MVNAVKLCEVLDISLDWLMMGRGTIDMHKAEPPDQVWQDVDDFIANLSTEMVENLNAMLEASYHKIRRRSAIEASVVITRQAPFQGVAVPWRSV